MFGQGQARRAARLFTAATQETGAPDPHTSARGPGTKQQGVYPAYTPPQASPSRRVLTPALAALASGHVVHPDAVKAQMEGGVIWGLSSIMHEEITIENGRVAQSNFTDYPVLKLAHTPRIESITMPSGGFWGGVGEPPIGAVIPAIGNALFQATGKRVRSMPLKNHGFSYKA